VGEDITHNIPAFLNVPLTIPHKERLVITGESFIPTNDFERLKDTLRDGNGKPYKNGQYEVLIRRTVSDVVFAFFRSMY
jgi:DNA ligase (NAD+)